MWLERAAARGPGVAALRCLLPAACEKCVFSNKYSLCDMPWTEQAKPPVFREFVFHVGGQMGRQKQVLDAENKRKDLKRSRMFQNG